MFRIGDFSQLGRVSIRTLRHYDEVGLLKPAHIDRFTDYRYYTIEQLPRLNRILALKDLGFSLDQIKRLLDDGVPISQLQGMLLLKQAEIEQQLQEEQMRLNRVAARLKQIEKEGEVSAYEVVCKSVEAQMIVSVRQIVPTIVDMELYRCALSEDLYAWLERYGVRPSAPEVVLYHMTEYKEEDIEIEMAVGVKHDVVSMHRLPVAGRVKIRELSRVQEMACVVHSGSLYDVGQAIVVLFTWINANGYRPDGAYREVHLFGREDDDQVDLHQIVIEMQIPIVRD